MIFYSLAVLWVYGLLAPIVVYLTGRPSLIFVMPLAPVMAVALVVLAPFSVFRGIENFRRKILLDR